MTSKYLIDIPGFTIESAQDVGKNGVYVLNSRVEDGRTKTFKSWVAATDLHETLCKALGITFAPEERLTPGDWCARLGARILDPDGWRGDMGRSWHDPITREEFDRRLRLCTIDAAGYPDFHTPPNREPYDRRNALEPGIQEL